MKVTYRAVFQQPLGVLNPMGCTLPGPCPVELFQRGDQWIAREIASPRRQVYEKLGKFGSLEHGQVVLKQSFERQLEDWQIWGTPALTPSQRIDNPKETLTERLLTPYDICSVGDGKFAWIEPEDRTHIMNGKTQGNERIPPTACGLKLPAKCFINNLANVAPGCRECAEIWRREYQK